MSYLNDKGFGPSLIPRNGLARALHYQWSELACDHVAPHVADLLGGKETESAVAALATIFDALETHLASKQYKGAFIVGEFSLADLHWAPYVHCCELAGKGALISTRPNIAAWWDAVKSHKSTSKEKFFAASVLPTMDEIHGKQLRSVSINA